MRQEEAIYELNTWCSGSDLRPQALKDAAEREDQLRRALASARRFRKASPEQVAALESQLLDARIERDRLGAEWAMELLNARQQRRAQALPVRGAA